MGHLCRVWRLGRRHIICGPNSTHSSKLCFLEGPEDTGCPPGADGCILREAGPVRWLGVGPSRALQPPWPTATGARGLRQADGTLCSYQKDRGLGWGEGGGFSCVGWSRSPVLTGNGRKLGVGAQSKEARGLGSWWPKGADTRQNPPHLPCRWLAGHRPGRASPYLCLPVLSHPTCAHARAPLHTGTLGCTPRCQG